MFFSIITYNFLATSSKLIEQVPSIFACLHFILTRYICSLTETMSRKFQEFSESMFDGSEKDRYFLKILKLQHKLSRDDKLGELVSYFLNNATKTCLYEIKVSEDIEIKHVCESKAFFPS